MTKMGSFVFFGCPPEGSGVAPRSRILRYFLRSSSAMLTHPVILRREDAEGSAPSRRCARSGRILRRLRGSWCPSFRPLRLSRPRLRRRALLRRRRARGHASRRRAFRRRAAAFQAAPQRLHDIDHLGALLLLRLLGHDRLALRLRLDAAQEALAVVVLVAERVELRLGELADEHLRSEEQ